MGIEYLGNRECAECGRPFHAKRSDALFCSSACRKNASRRREAEAFVSLRVPRETWARVASTVDDPVRGPDAALTMVRGVLSDPRGVR